jgi:hypothetical protein
LAFPFTFNIRGRTRQLDSHGSWTPWPCVPPPLPGKSLGVFESDPEKEARAKEAKRKQREGLDKVPVFGMDVRVKKTPDGQLRALGPDRKPIEPKPVEAYLQRAFKDKLEAAQGESEQVEALMESRALLDCRLREDGFDDMDVLAASVA